LMVISRLARESVRVSLQFKFLLLAAALWDM
jgi:hypothetical protein